MSKIGVIGFGYFGTALSTHLASLGHQVLAWTLESDVVEAVNSKHRHPHIFHEHSLHSNITLTNNWGDLADQDLLLIVVSSAALPQIVPQLDGLRPGFVVSAVKGLVGDSLETPLQAIEKSISSDLEIGVLSGPGFATDLMNQTPIGIVAASKNPETATKIAKIFAGGSLRVYTSSDPLGVELGGILKNVIAIGAGIADGLNLDDSTRAGLVTRGLAEMVRLAVAMGAQEKTLYGLSGLGDLVLTATCDASRNRRVGLQLGRGKDLEDIIKDLGSTAEGVRSAD